MKRSLIIILLGLVAVGAMAQPAKRRTTPTATNSQQNKSNQAGSERFSLMFPTSDAMPEDVAWRRDVYRVLDLTQEKNSPLYYPVQPIGNQCNLFTYIFRLVLTGRVSAYDYKITGLESFAAKDKINIKDFLSRYSIYYEEKDGKVVVGDADVPSELVKSYYIKESTYLDQRTGTMHTKVLALCPILLDGGEFGEEFATKKPLFWMKYDDVAPYLAKLPVMASDYNNVTNMTADDYFTLNRYEGKIYKTNNMQGRIIADYCKDDSAQIKESKRIDKQLADFEDRLWGHEEVVADSLDSMVVEKKPEKKAKKPTVTTSEKPAKTTTSRTRRGSGSKSDDSKATEAAAPRSTARRERR